MGTRFGLAVIAALPMASGALAQTCVPEWRSTFGYDGTDDVVFDFEWFDQDGPGPGQPTMFAAGRFVKAGGITVNRVARFENEAWAPVGAGIGQTTVYALAPFDEDGAGPLNASLFAAGDFDTAGGQPAPNIARWDGKTWSPVGGGTDDAVRCLTVWDDGSGAAIYAGGFFTTAGGAAASRIARWDGRAWTAVGPGTNDGVRALLPTGQGAGSELFVGGDFTTAGGLAASRIARWNGSAWAGFPLLLNGPVRALAKFDSGTGPYIYVGGSFSFRLLAWTGINWLQFGTPFTGSAVQTLWVHDDDAGGPVPPALYVGGAFDQIGGFHALSVARWSGTAWSSLGAGMHAIEKSAWTMETDDPDGSGPAPPRLWVGGDFTDVGQIELENVGVWSQGTWSDVGQGFVGHYLASPYVRALGSFDEDGAGPQPESLFAGGRFIRAGSVAADSFARWNGTQWSPVGGGLSNVPGNEPAEVRAMTVFDDGSGPGLYVGGTFKTAGGTPAQNIASWDGVAWTDLDLGSESGGRVEALTVHDDGAGPALYAGGAFASIGGVAATRIARWDRSAWWPLGSGLTSVNSYATVGALASFDPDGPGPGTPLLIASGSFSSAGGTPTPDGFAAWDGAQWSGVGGGLANGGSPGGAESICVFDDGTGAALYIAGSFNSAGGVPVDDLARWDGARFSAIGASPDCGRATHVAAADEDGPGPLPERLYAAGYFDLDGTGTRQAVIRWDGREWTVFADPISGGKYTPVSDLITIATGPARGVYLAGEFTAVAGSSADGIGHLRCEGGCYPDCNADGALTVADFGCFQTRFVAGDPYADCSADGQLSVQDFGCFQTAFVTGCP